jgi:large subunit ribosomal protein L4
MSATILSTEAAQQASLTLVEGHKGKQALNNVLVAYRANRRQGNACTKSRAEVSGSGKKMWRQKGTGNARMGSKRSPIWSGGGVVFGPKPRDFSQKIPKAIKKLALRTALTARINEGAIFTVESFAVADGKTKSFVAAVKDLSTATKVLIVGQSFDEATFRSARNVQNVQLISADDVNAEHLLLYRQVIVTTEALSTLSRRTA